MDFLTIFTKKKRIAAATAINAIPQTISETKEKTSLVNDKGDNPCNDKHQYSSKDGELPGAGLLLNRKEGCKTWNVEQDKHHEGA